MKPIHKVNAVAANTERKTPEKKQSKGEQIALRFAEVHVSKWNRSFGAQPDEQYITELARDIKNNGLLHPLTLVAGKDGNPPYAILAGANRFWALRKLRNEDSGLMTGEYVIRTDIKDDDPRCLDISLSENGHRRQSSVIETARYVDRLLQQEHVDQKKLAPKLGIRREVVCRMSKLVKCFDQLPESWRTELSRAPNRDSAAAHAITLSHWVEVAAKIGEGGVTEEVKAVLENAATDRWPTSALRAALKTGIGNGCASPQQSGEQINTTEGQTAPGQAGAVQAQAPAAGQPPASQIPEKPANPLQAVEKALDAMQAAVAALKTAKMPSQAKQMTQAAKTVERVLKQIEAAGSKAGGKKRTKQTNKE